MVADGGGGERGSEREGDGKSRRWPLRRATNIALLDYPNFYLEVFILS